MSDFTREKLGDVLERGAFDELRGEYENQWFDAKKEPYKFETIRQKSEFARDVCSFMNLDGGYILIGLRTKIDEDVPHFGEVVSDIHPFVPSLVDTEQMLDVLRSAIIPIPEHIEINWLPSISAKDLGIVAVKIPAQPEALKPFLHYFVDEKDKRASILFGFAKRVGSFNQSEQIHELQRALRLGLMFDREISNRLDSIQAKLDNSHPPSLGKSFDQIVEDEEKKVEDSLVAKGVPHQRLLVLSGFLYPKNQQITFSEPTSILTALDGTTTGLRKGGWKLLYSSEIEEKTPALIRTKRKDLRDMEVSADGSILYECNLNTLCFINGELLGNPPNIVPVALVEVVYQFVDFYFRFLGLLEVKTERCFLKVDLLNMFHAAAKTALPSYTAAPMTFTEWMTAPEDSFSKVIEVETRSPAAVSFLILNEIYHWFGFSEDQIPYKHEVDGGRYRIEIASFM